MIMKISSLYLQAFYQLSQDLNFTRAASSLAITQSAFSHRILNLESELETTLFVRDKGNIQLTQAGEKLLRYCEKALRLEEEALSSLTGSNNSELAGTIRLGGFSSIIRSQALPAIAPILANNPKTTVEVYERELSELLGLLKTSKADFIISNQVPQNQAIQADFLGFEINVLVQSKKLRLKNHYLDHDAVDVTTSSYFQLRPELNKNITRRYLDDVYGLIEGVKLELGRAVLPLHLIEAESDLEILYPKTKLKVPMYLLQYKSNFPTRLEKQVNQQIIKHFRQTMPQK
ncbi:MAG: LysR family transcriptional regulator [Bdellovibrionales bacterium]|nr:LysR family transcriptional regulator [Bdellovibrionales bacterium]